jgi:hypothetical protein
MESWSAVASASHVWVGQWSLPGTAGVGRGGCTHGLVCDSGLSPGQGRGLGSQTWQGSLETGPASSAGPASPRVRPADRPRAKD